MTGAEHSSHRLHVTIPGRLYLGERGRPGGPMVGGVGHPGEDTWRWEAINERDGAGKAARDRLSPVGSGLALTASARIPLSGVALSVALSGVALPVALPGVALPVAFLGALAVAFSGLASTLGLFGLAASRCGVCLGVGGVGACARLVA